MGRAQLALALFVLLQVGTVGSVQAAAERFALVVGSNHGGRGAGALHFAETDAARLAGVLEQLGSVPPENLTLLKSPTLARFEAAIEELEDRVADVKLRSGGHATVLFYFSGHALPDALQLGRQEVPFVVLRRALEGTGADVRLLFIDSCHAGAARRSKGAARAPGFLETTADADARGEVVITSSSSDELSQESDEVGGSYFTHYLLSGLRGAADSSDDGEVTLDEAYRYVYHRTVAHTAGTRAGTQHPGFDYDLQGSGDLVLTRLGAKGAALVFDELQQGRFLIFDEKKQHFVAEVFVTPGRPSRLLVESGTYRVQRRSPDALEELVLELRQGEEGRVEAERMRATPYSEDTTKGAVLRARREAAGREVVVSGRVGVQAFLDDKTREQLVPVMPLFGFEIDVRGFLGPMVSLRADLLGGTMSHQPELGSSTIPIQVAQLHGGLGFFLTPRVPGARALRPFAGLRLGVLWIHREFGAPLVQPDQDYVMAAPGLSAGMGLALSKTFRMGLEARTHMMLYIDNDAQQALGYFEGLFTIGAAL